jgi:acetoin utilization protein AcuB
MRAHTAMTRDVLVVSPAVTAGAARRMMERKNVRHLPVVTGGRLVGILSDRDLLPQAAASLTCGEAMTSSLVTCRPDTSVSRIAELMLAHKIDSVPVVDEEQQLVGLVTSSDLLSLLVERHQAQILPFSYNLRLTDSDAAVEAVA